MRDIKIHSSGHASAAGRFVTCTQACQWKITDQISDFTGQQAGNKAERFMSAPVRVTASVVSTESSEWMCVNLKNAFSDKLTQCYYHICLIYQC